MADIYAHPTITSNPLRIAAVQMATGLHAIAQGHRVRLVAPPAVRRGIEQRGRRLFVVESGAEPRGDFTSLLDYLESRLREDPPGRPG